ncbi:kinesin [Aspergillus arachidicola]|uniref:Kinesin n=1 Tax=Aspergillus arachidicola TaxID=656916 RepID=A0A2G7G6I9_9EURO|nr:kinesin [Aspergillus arachidicola]
MLYVVGPGHGAPGLLASLWLEGSLGKFYPQYSRDKEGLKNLISTFSTSGGLPSHINAETPGAIHEGGELGYALAVSFGAVMDNPDLIVTCVVGDGEAETGPTATSWHAIKYIDPAESGAVLPILHVNGFKISERTIFGCMDNKELISLFTGYGYQVRIVENLDDIDTDLHCSMNWAVGEIHKIQQAARSGKPIMKPRWPMIVLRTPKGWSGPKELHGQFIEGSFQSHQVPLPNAKKDKEELQALQKWLSSYNPHELFTETGDVIDEVKSIIPSDDSKKLGQRFEAYKAYEPPNLPDWRTFCVEKGAQESSMKTIGKFIDKVFTQNPHSVRLFSPDELESNKLDAALAHTGRNFQWDQYSNAKGGRVIEVLSEHMCQGFLQGYTLTGRVGLFPSYESFLGIVHTMMVQYAKFMKMARETGWHKDVASINYIETSTWTRQEHNGFSHQNPSFIGNVLKLKPNAARVYLPPDANTFLTTLHHCLKSKNYINLMVGSKQPTPVYLSPEEAESHCRAGTSIWKFCSTNDGLDPDVVLVGVGVEVMFEVIYAAAILRQRCPELRVRVINVTDLMILENEGAHPHALTTESFDNLFTSDKPIHFNYHGYVTELQGLLFGRPRLERVSIAGYIEEGSTTTPFDMMLVNKTSRFHVAQAAIKGAAKRNEKVRLREQELSTELNHNIVETRKYIYANRKDPDDIGRFQRTGSLNKPPRVLLTAISQMQSDNMMGNRPVHGIISRALLKNQAMQEQFSRPQEDLLFHTQYNHQPGALDCSNCDRGKVLARALRPIDDPYIHYGLIASGDQVIKDATTRDTIAQESGMGVLCFEMEAAGLMDQLPSLVIRGICDYCDSHKNKSWQGYAAIVAAAYAKVLLSVVPVHHHHHKLELGKMKEKAWMVPFGKNTRFIGRESEIAELEGRIENSKGPSKIAICGLGGVGKTQIALELAYRLQSRNSDYSVFWIPCTSHESVEQAYMTLAQIVGIHNVQPAEAKNSVKAFLSQSTGRWLLIFDNADDIDMWIQSCAGNPNPVLVDFLPQSDQGRILFTTRNRKLAVKLASSDVIDISEPDIETTTKILAGLSSSGNSQAAAYINENDIGFTEYVMLLQEPEPEVIELLSEGFGDGEQYKSANPVATTWLISFQQIQRLSQLAADYLSFMACISPRDIPQSLLPSAISKKKKVEAIGLLKAFSFINEQAEGRLSLHRLVYYATRNWMRKNRQLDPYIRKTADQLTHVFPTEDHTNRKLWRQYLPHAVALISQREFLEQQKIYATLLEKVGMCLYRDGRYGEAEDPVLRAMNINVQILGREHTSTLDSMARLAWIHMKQGRWKDAEQLQVHVLAASKRVLGPKHLDTLASMNDLACTYHEQGRQEESENLQIQALAALKETLGLEHAVTLTSMNNLASVYRHRMRWKEAEDLELQVIKLRKRVLGLDHPDTVTAMNNMALIYQGQERWKEAEALGVQVIEARKTIIGEEHPDTLASMIVLALGYRDQKRWKEAEDLMLKVIKTQKQVIGPEHLDTLNGLEWLASTYWSQGRRSDAEKIYSDLVETYKRVLGAQHPKTVSNMAWLAHIYWHQRRWKDVEELETHILETRKCVLGPEHPDTLAIMHDLAHTLMKFQQKVGDALALMEQCVSLRDKVLGPDHPDTLRSSHKLSEFKKADHFSDTNQQTSDQVESDQSMRETSTAMVNTAPDTKHINRAKGLTTPIRWLFENHPLLIASRNIPPGSQGHDLREVD